MNPEQRRLSTSRRASGNREIRVARYAHIAAAGATVTYVVDAIIPA